MPARLELSRDISPFASNDPVNPSLSIPLIGTAFNTATTALVSDSFNRANATECSLGTADNAWGGTGAYILPADRPAFSGKHCRRSQHRGVRDVAK